MILLLDILKWLILLKNYDKLNVRMGYYMLLLMGYMLLKRLFYDYVRYGVINLDKLVNLLLYEVVVWIWCMLRVDKIGYSGMLDFKVMGSLIVCVDRVIWLVKV